MVGGQDMAQDRDLWFLILLALPQCGNFYASVAFFLDIIKVAPRVFMGIILTAETVKRSGLHDGSAPAESSDDDE